MTNRILAELARTKALFQARAIATILGAPPPTVKDSLTVAPLDTPATSMSTMPHGLKKPTRGGIG